MPFEQGLALSEEIAEMATMSAGLTGSFSQLRTSSSAA
jgi:hypothetical protein